MNVASLAAGSLDGDTKTNFDDQQSFHALDSRRTAVKTSEIIHSTLTLYVANIGINVKIIWAPLNNENRNFRFREKFAQNFGTKFLAFKMPIHDFSWT